jgi:type I restriction enzyme S subunit
MPTHHDHTNLIWQIAEPYKGSGKLGTQLNLNTNTAGSIIVGFPNVDEQRAIDVDLGTMKVAREGDIVFNKMRMWQGAVEVSPCDGLTSPDYVVATLIGDDLLTDYAKAIFRTPVFSAECARYSVGLTWDRLRLYWEGFRDISVPLPPLAEQLAIVSHITVETVKLDALRSSAQRTIGLLKERRSALISTAVTGKLAIPN